MLTLNYFLEENPVINKVKKATNCNIGCENGTVNNHVPEGILENMISRLSKLETIVLELLNKNDK